MSCSTHAGWDMRSCDGLASAGRIRLSAAQPSPGPAPGVLLRAVRERLGPGTVRTGHRLVAFEQHVSLRYLYKLFETEQTAVADWIRRRRLEHCRLDLLNPSLRGLPVSAIATRRGLTSPAHFNRLFRATYNVPPGEYRQAHG